jgi:DNA-binding SARP family transcriptional activator
MAFLALHYGRAIGRSRVAGALWPDLNEGRARADLSTAIWRIRQALGESPEARRVLVASGDSLMLGDEHCDVDVVQFHRGLPTRLLREPLALERAIESLNLYKGDLLEEWDVEWCQHERERLRRLYIEGLIAVAEAFDKRGRVDLAVRYARSACDKEPLDEDAQRLLIELLLKSGNRSSALAQFRRFSELTKAEFGARPDDRTLALIRDGQADRRRSTTGSPIRRFPGLVDPDQIPLVGRRDEQLQAGAFIEAAYRGRGGTFVIEGDAGVGKSRLVRWIIDEWISWGGTVCAGRCVGLSEPVPYQSLMDALDEHVDFQELLLLVAGSPGDPDSGALQARESRIEEVPAGRGNAIDASRFRFFGLLGSRIGQLARTKPLLIAIEDVQWADAGTLDFITYLTGRAAALPLGILVTRQAAAGREVARHDQAGLTSFATRAINLGPLPHRETAELVAVLLGHRRITEELYDWVFRETEGNPLFVVETLRLLDQQGLVDERPGSGVGPSGTLTSGSERGLMPGRVRSILQQRFAFLSPDALTVAEAASALGRGFDAELLRTVVRMRPSRLAKALGGLEASGILIRDGGVYRFSHDKIRMLCYEGIPSRQRRAYHARSAAALRDKTDVPIQQVAWHQEAAGEWAAAVDSWTLAGDRAHEMLAHQEAWRAYERALACLRREASAADGVRRDQEIALLGKSDLALARLGRPLDRRRVLAQLLDLCVHAAGDEPQAACLLRVADLEDHVGDFDQARRAALAAWGIARRASLRRLEVEALKVLSWELNRVGRMSRALAVSRLALRKCPDNETSLRGEVLAQIALAEVKMADYASASRSIGQARNLLVSVGHAGDHPYLSVAEAIAQKWTGDLRGARVSIASVRAAYHNRGDQVGVARADLQLAGIDAFEGKIGDALRGVRRALVASRDAGYVRLVVTCFNEMAYGVARQMGSYDLAWGAAARALELAGAFHNSHLNAIILDSQAQLLIDQGRFQEAFDLTANAIGLLQSRFSRTSEYYEAVTRRGSILLGLGDCAAAIRDLEEAREARVRIGENLLLADTLSYLAMAYAGIGETNKAADVSAEALRVLASVGFANHQPQRIFWHHYQILGLAGVQTRPYYLNRAAEFIESQAATLSPAQQRRLKYGVPLNQAILGAWHSMADSSRARPEEMPGVSAPVSSQRYP